MNECFFGNFVILNATLHLSLKFHKKNHPLLKTIIFFFISKFRFKKTHHTITFEFELKCFIHSHRPPTISLVLVRFRQIVIFNTGNSDHRDLNFNMFFLNSHKKQ